MEAKKPAISWEKYKAANPGTAHTHVTYCAGGFNLKETHGADKPGDVFNWDGTAWRVVQRSANPFAPVLAVPAVWPEHYWED